MQAVVSGVGRNLPTRLHNRISLGHNARHPRPLDNDRLGCRLRTLAEERPNNREVPKRSDEQIR